MRTREARFKRRGHDEVFFAEFTVGRAGACARTARSVDPGGATRRLNPGYALLSPGGRYVIDEAFCKAAIVSSTVSNAVVCKELSAPPAPIAIAVAAIET